MKSFINSKFAVFITIAIITLIFAGCGNKPAEPADTAAAIVTASTQSGNEAKTELIIAAAASLKDAGNEIAEKYKTTAPDIKITYTFGSSGALQKQIEEGAPADVFFSAAAKQMSALDKEGLVNKDTKKDLLLNELVLIVPKDSKAGITTFDKLGTDSVKTVALGEPGSVPAGQYSEEIFKSLGILDKVKKKANYGSDVRQVLTWVENGEADCGVVYKTDAMTSKKVSVVGEAPKDSHKKVVYPVAVLKNSAHAKEAQDFVNYLSSAEAKDIFTKYGFSINK
jgi:molybdate transport system substrate-binding protein